MTLRGLINAVFEASCLAWRWRRPVLAGAAIGSPSVRRRPTTVLSTASRARDSTSDALCRAQLLPRKLARFPLRARPAFPVVSSKPPVRSDQSAFHRRMLPVQAGSQATPGTGTRHRSHGFAAARRLPEPVRALVHPRFPRGGPEARPDASPRGPSSVRRLLQPKLTREHALRILRSLELVRPVARALTLSGGVASLLAPRSEDPARVDETPVEVSRARGRGWLSPPQLLSSRLLARRASPQPDGLGHPASWNREERGWIGRSHQARDEVACRLRIHPSGSLSRA
jgi:hypothetical protein